jgi:hypothetical protein
MLPRSRWCTAALIFFALAAKSAAHADTGVIVQQLWAVNAGDILATAAAAHADGTSVITGHFDDSASFGAAGSLLGAEGGRDGFVAKLDSAGTFLWAVRIGGSTPRDTKGCSIAAHADGTSVVTGYFGGTASFGAAGSLMTGSGNTDVFVAKLDSAGTFLWAISFSGSNANKGYGIAAHADGTSVVTGSFGDTASFGAAGNLTVLGNGGGNGDVFVAKLDSAGTVLWAVRFGDTSTDAGYAIAAHADGTSVVTGECSPTPFISFGGKRIKGKSGSVFVTKVDSAGTVLWAVLMGGREGRGIAAHADGTSVVTGYFSGSYSLIEPFGAAGSLAAAGYDGFVAKVNASGAVLWAVRFGGTSHDYGYGIAAQAGGTSVITGSFQDTASFGAAGSLTALGRQNGFIAKLNSTSGVFLWAVGFGGGTSTGGNNGYGGTDMGCGIAAHAEGTVVAAGSLGRNVASPANRNVASFANTTHDVGGFVCAVKDALPPTLYPTAAPTPAPTPAPPTPAPSPAPAITSCEGRPDGAAMLSPDGGAPFATQCHAGGVVIQKRTSNATGFYKSWTAYAAGFGDEDNLWLGNDNIHRLTANGTMQLHIELTTGPELNYAFAFADYAAFKVGDAASKYLLAVSGYSGNATDSFSSGHTFYNGSSGVKFSTHDQDNDESNASCAKMYKGGWWYHACHESNLNGVYYGGNHTSYADGMDWYYWTGFHHSMSKTLMVVKPRPAPTPAPDVAAAAAGVRFTMVLQGYSAEQIGGANSTTRASLVSAMRTWLESTGTYAADNITALPTIVSVDVDGAVNSGSSGSSNPSVNVTMVVTTATEQGAKDVLAAVATIGRGGPRLPFKDVFVDTEGAKGNAVPPAFTIYTVAVAYYTINGAPSPAADVDLMLIIACGAGACVLVALLAGAAVKNRTKRMDETAVREAVGVEMGELFTNPMGNRQAAARFAPPKELMGTVAPQARLKEVEAALAVQPPSVSMSAAQAAVIDANFGTLRTVFEGLVRDADEEAMHAVLQVQGKSHALAYFACHNIVKEEGGYETLAASVKQAAAQFPGSRNGRRTCAQTAHVLPALYEHARTTRPLFDEKMEEIVAQFDGRMDEKGEEPAVKLHKAPLKGLYRCAEKMCLQGDERRFDAGCICDVVRCIVECNTCAFKEEILRAIISAFGVEILRIKDRVNHITSMKWMDIMVNFKLGGDSREHVCEVQIVHSKMLVARKNLGGHKPYAQLRAATEILEVLDSERAAASLKSKACKFSLKSLLTSSSQRGVTNAAKTAKLGDEQHVAKRAAPLPPSTPPPQQPPQQDTWSQHFTDEGHAYYSSALTGSTQWEAPEGFV